MKNIALFGGSGFLGTHLQAQLDGRMVVVSLRGTSWESLIPANTNVFINVIGKAHDHKKEFTAKDYWEANVDKVKALFDVFLNSNASLFIHISSIAVIEETGRAEPLTETSKANPESLYGKSKKEAEDFLIGQVLPAGKQLVILRPPMIYGPGDKGNLRLLYQFAVKGFPYPLGAYDNQRTFLSVDNLAYIMNKIIALPDALYEKVYNIADDEAVSTMDIIKIAGEAIGKKPLIISIPRFFITLLASVGGWLKLSFNKPRLNKMTSTLLVSNLKIKAALNISQLPVTVKQGLKKTFESFNS